MSLRISIHFVSLTCLWILLATPLLASTSRIYVVSGAGDGIDVVNPETDKVVQRIGGMEGAIGIAFSPDGRRVYVSDDVKKLVYLVDPKTGKIIRRVLVNGQPDTMAISKDGKTLFVALKGEPPAAGIDVVDTTALRVVKTIPMQRPMHDIYLTSDSRYLIAGSDVGKFLVVIDLQSNQPVWNVSFDQPVYTMAIDSRSDGSPKQIFVQLQRFNGFTIVDFDKRGNTRDVFLPDEPSGFLGGSPNPSHGIGIAPDGKTVWVNSGQANSVFVYSLPDLRMIRRVSLPERSVPGKEPLGAQPDWLTFTPDGRKVYVSDTQLNSVSAIDTETMTVVAVISVGRLPRILGTLVMPN